MPAHTQWTIIKPKTGWFDINVSDHYKYQDLIWLFVRRNFVTIYKQTVLGPLWLIIQPLLTTLVFTIIFGRIAKLPTDGLPPFLFYMCGNTAWAYFANCLNGTANTFVSNAGLFGKVYFPRLTVPISVVITNLISFVIQFSLFLALILYFVFKGMVIHPNLWILYLPVLLVQMALLGLGFGIVISSATTKYRDLANLVGFGVQLWMYFTPIVYPLSQIPAKWQQLYLLNPMAPVIETFRYAFLGTGSLPGGALATSATITLAILLIGVLMFSRTEKTFMDTV